MFVRECRAYGAQRIRAIDAPALLRISCTGRPQKSACAAFVKESRVKCANASKLHRKSGFRAGLTFGPRPYGPASV